MDFSLSKIVMWICVMIIVTGLILSCRCLNEKMFFSKYEGIIVSMIGLAGVCCSGMLDKIKSEDKQE